jgi:hypothetical protein
VAVAVERAADSLPIEERAGVVDELQACNLAGAERDRPRTTYGYAVDRDKVALAWAIRALAHLISPSEKAHPELPKPPHKPKWCLSAEERAKYHDVPS